MIKIEELKKGTVFYEYSGNMESKYTVEEEPVITGTTCKWKGVHIKSGRVVEFGFDTEYPHYAPKIYTYRAYMGCVEV